MPSFRVHQTRFRPERVLIKLIQGKYIIPQVQVQNVPVQQPAIETKVPEKAKTTISLKQIKLILALLQKSEHKDLSKLLSPELTELLSLDEDKVDEIETVEETVEETKEEKEELNEEDDDDVLIIDV